MNKRIITGGLIALAFTAGSLGSAEASSLIGSKDIKDGGVHRVDLSNGINRQLDRTVNVTKFGGVVAARDGDQAGLHMTGDGVQFGPFADGGACSNPGTDFARMNFNGLNGKKLHDVHQLDYTGWMVSSDNTGGVGSLTMRIYLKGGTDRLTFSPNTQFNTPADYADSQGEVHTWLVTHGTLRLNDDAGDNPAGELPFKHWAAASQNGNERIDHVDVLLGCQSGHALQGVVRSVQANGTDYDLGRLG